MRSLLLALTAAMLLVATPAPERAASRLATGSGFASAYVPHGWLGVVADGPLTAAANPFDAEWDLMTANGVETVRTAFYWSEAQPRADATDWSAYDPVVAAAARRRLSVVPIVHRTPSWAAARPGDIASPPRDPATYAAFLTALVARYGPSGSFWAEHPELPRMPVRDWQIWNEPNLTRYWTRQPFARSYVRLLRAAHAAIRAADPGARVVLAGLPNESWTALRSVYRAGGRGAFDVVALHPYTGKPRNVVRLVEFARREMRRARDRLRPVWITELSWPAAKGRTKNTPGFETDDRGQAHRLADGLERLAKARRRLKIDKVIWYTWLSREGSVNSFDWSGLRRLRRGRLVTAPALGAFRRTARRLQGCAKRAGDASACG
jgi:hypothetical protein